MKTVRLCLMLYLMLLAVTPVVARVFWRRQAGRGVAQALQHFGGMPAYRSTVRIDGAPAIVTITGFDDPEHRMAIQIYTALQLDAPPAVGDTLHLIERDGNVTRLLLLRPGGGATLLAVTIEQTAAAFRQARRKSSRDTFPLPVYPGATQGLQLENEDTGLHFITLTAAADHSQVASYYRHALYSAGWTQPFSDTDARAGLVFLRQHAMCMIFVSPGQHMGESHITLFHKPFQDGIRR